MALTSFDGVGVGIGKQSTMSRNVFLIFSSPFLIPFVVFLDELCLQGLVLAADLA